MSETAVAARLALTQEQKEFVTKTALKHYDFALQVFNTLDLERLPQTDQAFRELLIIVRNFTSQHGRLPDEEELSTEGAAHMQRLDGLDNYDDILNDMEDLAEDVYQTRAEYWTSERRVSVASNYLSTWSQQNATSKLLDTIRFQIGNATAIQQAARQYIESSSRVVTQIDFDNVFPNGELPTAAARRMIPTGLFLFDGFTGGGLEPGETLLFLGPFGSCKTTAAVQACAESAKICRDSFSGPDCPMQGDIRVKPVVVLVSFEMNIAEFRRRVLSYLAKIPFRRYRQLGGRLTAFHDEPTPQEDYERIMFGDRPAVYQSEQQRIRSAMTLVREHILFVDILDGSENFSAYGKNGIEDVANILRLFKEKKEREQQPVTFHAVFVDHISALVNRQWQKGGIRLEDKTAALNDCPRTARDMIGNVHQTAVVLLGQLSGEGNKRARNPAANLDHTQGKDCTTVAEFVDFAVQVTSPSEDERQLAVASCSKHRREPPRGSNIVFAVDGPCAVLTDKSEYYSVENGEFCERT